MPDETKRVVAVCSTFRRNIVEGDGGLARPDAPEVLCRDPQCPIHGSLSPETYPFDPPPAGFEWTGEVRPPKKGEFFWSEIRGDVVVAEGDETGVRFDGVPTGGRRILRRAPASDRRLGLRAVKEGENP